MFFFFFFFFQAEDGIRDLTVTGVQTCALPISNAPFLLKRSAPGSFTRMLGSALTAVTTAPRGVSEGGRMRRGSIRSAPHAANPTATGVRPPSRTECPGWDREAVCSSVGGQ